MNRFEKGVLALFATFEFDALEEAEAAIMTMRTEFEVTGEFHIQRIEGRGWRLKLNSEKPLREPTLARLPGRRVDQTP